MSTRSRSNAKADIWDTEFNNEDLIRFMMTVMKSKYYQANEENRKNFEARATCLSEKRNGKRNIWQEFQNSKTELKYLLKI